MLLVLVAELSGPPDTYSLHTKGWRGGGGGKRERICVDDASLLEDFQWSLQGNQELHSHWF